MRLDSKAWHSHVGQVIGAIGQDEFPEVLLRSISALVPYDCSLTVEFQQDSQPKVLSDHLLSNERAFFENVWLKGAYLLGPYYNAYLNGLPNGFYSLRQVAPDAFTKSNYYNIYFRHVGQSDMCGFVVWPTPDRCIILNVARSHYNARFSAPELRRLRKIEPMVRPAMARHWRSQGRPKENSTTHDNLMKRASAFGRHVLSDREYEVVHYLLRGHSTKSIAHQIDVSAETVRAHRKNTYRKLGVRSQGELFSTFIAHLATEPAA